MAFRTLSALRCPLDDLPLMSAGGCLRCENAHTFDIARQGYVNLLGSQHKRSRDPGDSKAMIAARRRFLDAGFYRPIPERLTQILASELGSDSLIVDAGCGEGYYLEQIRQQLLDKGQSEPDILGFDISKWAVQSAARRFSATWVVASNRRIPLADCSADVILDSFGFPDFAEFSRVLKPSGLLIRVEAGRQHLLELRRLIYENVENRDGASAIPSGFLRRDRDNLTYKTSLSGNNTIADLLLMTPHLFRASSEGKQRAAKLPGLTVTVDAVVDVLQKA